MGPRTVRAFALLVSSILIAACGGDGRGNAPTPMVLPSPTPEGVAAGSLVAVVRGDNGSPVAGAAVTVAGRTYVADAAGTVLIADAAPPGALVDVTAPSVLDRQTSVGRGPLRTLVLWPRSTAAGIDEAFTATVVYTRATLFGSGPVAMAPLQRITAGATTAVIVLDPGLLADEFAHAAHLLAVERMNVAARGAITYSLARETPATAGALFIARVDTADPDCGGSVLAFVRTTLGGGEIDGGEIVYCRNAAPHRIALVLHELGHTFGLQHSEDPRDMMFHTINAAHADDFRAREVEVMSLVLQRRGGNRFPDSDRAITGASPREQLIVCR